MATPEYTEHTIRGSVPAHEWETFLKQHFKSSTGESKPPVEHRPASQICGSLGCPGTFGGGSLHHCSVDVESDGSATIHCYYL
jgi:hypothetical protein